MRFPKANYVYLLILLPAIYFAIFLHLDSFPFRVWDEAFLGMHTYEMMEGHDYVVTHSFGAPEMSNTKPPLVIWCMVLSSRVLGFSELSLRIPNAIAGILICLILFFFISAYLRSGLCAFLSVFILLSTPGFIGPHIIRTGEYDAFLTLFTLTYCIAFFLIIEYTGDRKPYKYWCIFALAVTGAILTKGIAGVLFMPGLFIYTLTRRRLLWVARSGEAYAAAFFILFFGLGYYFLREHFNPGYLKAVYENELGGRYAAANEGHRQGFIFYWNLIACDHLIFIMPFIFIGIIKAFLNETPGLIDRMVRFCTYVSLTFIFILSFSATKLSWYDAPALPMAALAGGFGFYTILSFLLGGDIAALSIRKKIIVTAFIAAALGPAYGGIITDNLNMADFDWNRKSYTVTYYIKRNQQKHVDLDGYKVIYDPYLFRSQLCQIKEMEYTGKKIEVTEVDKLKKGDKVVLDKESIRTLISNKFGHIEIDSLANVKVWQIL